MRHEVGGANEGTGDGDNVMSVPPMRLVISGDTSSNRTLAGVVHCWPV